MELAELTREWVAGWVVSRAAPPPVAEPWGLRIEVGAPDHLVRHVLPDADEATVRKVAAEAGRPGTCIKALVAAEDVDPWPEGNWRLDDPGFLMAVELRAVPVPETPEGYAVGVRARGDLTWVHIRAGDGSVAAHGQVAVVGATAVVDKVETRAGHRRRGLGSVVMRTLAGTAVDRGAVTGVLGASVEGRALYESLGWRMCAPLTGFVCER